MSRVGLLIPVYKPPFQLISLVDVLLKHRFLEIIVVNDGSPKGFEEIFSQLKRRRKVTILSHKTNRGKGAALKTGFEYFLQHHPKAIGIVTADADGQHSVSDILRVATALRKKPHHLVLGCRQFDRNVPLKNHIGNRFTRFAFKTFLGLQD